MLFYENFRILYIILKIRYARTKMSNRSVLLNITHPKTKKLPEGEHNYLPQIKATAHHCI